MPFGLHDDRINIRPYILAACFAWGVICGFLFHVLGKPAITIDDQKSSSGKKNTAANNQEDVADAGVTDDAPERVKRQAALPDFPTPADPVIAGIESPTQRNLEDQSPDIPPLPLNPEFGLTGRTSSLPSMPTRLDKPSPEPPRPTPRPTWSEWDDPDMVF